MKNVQIIGDVKIYENVTVGEGTINIWSGGAGAAAARQKRG